VYEQRKVVTALFCDLVGSTELSGVLEPETLRMVVLRYFEVMRGQIEQYGGTVEKFIGDAVMAVFGVPVVHEDDAHRAAAAALGMLTALDTLNEELVGLGCRLAVRIGLNTGEVVTAGGDSAVNSLVSGEVVHVAARLEQQAAAGQILLGPITRILLGPGAGTEAVGPLVLKGVHEPVPAFRLLGLPPDGPEHPLRLDAPYVGREAERARLTELWQEVSGSIGSRLVTVTGDAGIGKTRLLRQWLAGLADEEALVGASRCHPYREEASLAPLGAAAGRLLEGAAEAGLSTGLGAAEPALTVLRTGLLNGGTPYPTMEDTCAAITTVLAELAAARPVVLVLDDLHWARPSLLEALRRISDGVSADRLLLLCSGRPEPEWPRRLGTDATGLRLAPLPRGDASLLAARLMTAAGVRTARSAEVVDRAEGNPLYIEHLLAILGDGADLRKLPATVTAVLTARIDALPAAERAVLDAGAVLGPQFDQAEAMPLIDALSPREQAAAVDQLVRRGLLEVVPGSGTGPGPRHRFASGLVHDVTYQAMSKLRRAACHERAAGGPGVRSAAAGHHYEQAYLYRAGLGLRDARTTRLRSHAGRALADAGRHALACADPSWSEELHERALRHCSPDDPWWTRAAQGLGETWLALGKPEEGGRLLRNVLDVARSTGDRLAGAHVRLLLASQDADAGAAARAARAGLAAFTAASDRLGLARAGVRLAQEQQFLGRFSDADLLLADALRHAVAAGAAPERAMALGALGISLWQGPTPAAAAVRRCRGLLAEHGPDHAVAAVTLTYPLANLLALRGDFDAARDCLAEADRLVSGLTYAEATAVAPLFAAGVEELAGDLPTAERLLRTSVLHCRLVGLPGLLATASRALARVVLGLGAALPPELLAGATASSVCDEADLLGVRALGSAAGHPEKARELARRAVAVAATTDSPLAKATAELDLARTCRITGRPAEARQAAECAGAWFRAKGHTVGYRAATLLGEATADGRQR
jgi:class 3 adenylate cyclase/tetratricopeptide (TPR) repeat protein